MRGLRRSRRRGFITRPAYADAYVTSSSPRADPASALAQAQSTGGGLDAQAVVHGTPEFLFAPKVPLRRLNGHVPEEERDLIQFAARQVAQTAQVRRWSCGASLAMPAEAAAVRSC